eukprot:Hpha_TRINITY_DN15820_c1_g18::TRINITY_DN15820_c1_g18_i1::g.187177::m.187177
MSASRFWSRRARAELGGVGTVLWPKTQALGNKEGVINLGQGFPDYAPPPAALEGARGALSSSKLNQYSPVGGTPRLKEAVCRLNARLYPNSPKIDPVKGICVTSSGTEGLFSAMQAFLDEGDEVLVFEPAFPWYQPCIRMAGGVPVPIELAAPNFTLPSADELRKRISGKTKMVMFNTPHNPTGHVVAQSELEGVAEICREANLVCVADEVYEACVFPGSNVTHRRIVDLPGMGERTITIAGASKLLSLTGWRIGWVTGDPDLIAGLRTVQSYMSYSAPHPLQAGCAAAIEAALEPGGDLTFGGLGDRFQKSWGTLARALRNQGVRVCPAEGGYFLVADVGDTGLDDWEYCQWLAEDRKVAAIPMKMFYTETDTRRTLVRFAICKEQSLIDEAAKRLEKPFSRITSARL